MGLLQKAIKKSKLPAKKATRDFTRVIDLETGLEGTVCNHLSVQFTAAIEGARFPVQFYFYKDKNVTWRVA
jgi:hypothetical protein